MMARSRLSKFFCDLLTGEERGTSMIEMAMVAPFLGVLTLGIADYSRGFAQRLALESAAHRTLERAGVGSTQTDYSFLKQEAANAAGVPLTDVTLDNWLECGGTRMTNYDDPCTDGAQQARYIYVKIEKNFTLSIRLPGQPQTMRLYGDAAVRVQ
jgi:Flp pilus assembly protein TadG